MVKPVNERRVKHSSRIELSQSALRKNINFIRKKIGSHPRLSAVVKANAYGHGIAQIVPMLEKCGVDHFSVASAFEAEEVVESCSPGTTVMIMGILYDQDINWAIENDVEFYVFDYYRLPIIHKKAVEIGKKAIIHIEVETGTNRTGMTETYFRKALAYLQENQGHIQLEGICTHLGGAESLALKPKIDRQVERFDRYLKELENFDLHPRYRHVACSAAALAFPSTHYDLVRVGVAIYGFWPSPDIYFMHLQQTEKPKDAPMSRVISWKTDIMDIKNVPQGQFIGYGTAFQATHDLRIAVIPVGYSNGYPRGQSNRGQVLIAGRRAPIVGLINMNLFMVDISHIPEAQIGDEVVLIGKQRNNTIRVSSFTDINQLLNTEMLSRLPTAIPRQVVK